MWRLVVEGNHHQEGIGILEQTHIGQGSVQRIATHTGQYGMSVGVLKCHFQKLEFLRLREGGGFGGSAQRHQKIHAGGNLPIHRCGIRRVIHLAAAERSE